MLTRRAFASLLGVSATPVPPRNVRAQGVATRNVIAEPGGKPSGLLFHAHFKDVAKAAGLHEPVICGASFTLDPQLCFVIMPLLARFSLYMRTVFDPLSSRQACDVNAPMRCAAQAAFRPI